MEELGLVKRALSLQIPLFKYSENGLITHLDRLRDIFVQAFMLDPQKKS